MKRKPEPGDQVVVFTPGRYQRFGKVIATDYHPFGVDDAALVLFGDEINDDAEWVILSYIAEAPREQEATGNNDRPQADKATSQDT